MSKKTPTRRDHDLIVTGDLTTPKLTDKILTAVVSHGLRISKPLVELAARDRVIGGSNRGKDARYDDAELPDAELPCQGM